MISCSPQGDFPATVCRRQNILAKIALIERALALDPNYVWALREDARNLAILVLNGFSSDRDADLARATKALDRALQLAPNDVEDAEDKAIVLRARGDLDEAAVLSRRVIELAPAVGLGDIVDLGQILLIARALQGGSGDVREREAAHLAHGSRPRRAIDSNLAMGLLVNDRFPEAIAQARLAIGEFPPESGRIAEGPGWF